MYSSGQVVHKSMGLGKGNVRIQGEDGQGKGRREIVGRETGGFLVFVRNFTQHVLVDLI